MVKIYYCPLLKKLKIYLPYDPAIPLLGIYPKKPKTLILRDSCTPMFIAALFTITKIWKQPKLLSIDEWMKEMWDITHTHTQTHTHNGILLGHKKEQNFATCNNMDGLGRNYTKWNKWDRNTDTVRYHSYVECKKHNKLVNVTKKCSRLTDIENRLVVTVGRQGRGIAGVREGAIQTIQCKIGCKDVLY